MRHKRYQIAGTNVVGADTVVFGLKDGNYPLPDPGQFYMIWLPGISENPVSASDRRSVTIRDIGDVDERRDGSVSFSHAAMSLKTGDYIMMRGPLGHGFKIHDYVGNKAALVAMGCGAAPMRYLAAELMARSDVKRLDRRTTCILAAKRAEELLFEDDFRTVADDLLVCTDNGSRGEKGAGPQFVDALGVDAETDVYVCGPEVAMKAAAEALVANGANPGRVQLLIERYMKCGEGVCGACDCGGKRVCKYGPVFTYQEMAGNADFGRFGRDMAGTRIPLKKTQAVG